ncbi:MAG: ATP-binding protein, partial [Bacteroidota bacterium]
MSGILTLLGIEADAMSSPEHVFLAKVIGDAWVAGRSLTLADLIGALQAPPFETIGVLGVDQFFPAKQRTSLAMKLNGLLASPGFAAWAQGEAMDADRFFHGPDGTPQISIFSIAHLGDEERMFFVTRLLGEVLAWMRRQPGTDSLRAILYMDEIFGYLPPQGNPASKALLLTLLKQARAFGLGVVLATQNPVDMDYKALSNCGTWFVGRLQTERDKERLLDGLEGASQSSGFNRAEVDQLLSGIGKRRFLLHNVHEDAPVLMGTRWVLSYLAGPLTRAQIGTLMADRKAEAATRAPASAAASVPAPAATGPSEPATEAGGVSEPPQIDVPQVVLDGDADEYVPMLLARAEVPFERKRPPVDHTARHVLLAEVVDGAPQ